MKGLMKRINRGLLLGAVVLVVFVIFAVTDTISFKKNKPQIESAVTEYLDALADLAEVSDNEGEFKKKTDKLISDYWCSENNSGTDYNSADIREIRLVFEDAAEKTDHSSGYITKYNVKPYSSSIKKAGPGYATVDFECDIVAEFRGDPCIITPYSVMPVSYFGFNEEIKDTYKLKRFSFTGEYMLTFRQKDGKWKVCQSQEWGRYNMNVSDVDESEGGEA